MDYIYSREEAIKKLKEDPQYLHSKEELKGLPEPEKKTFYRKKTKSWPFGKVDFRVPEGYTEHFNTCFHWVTHFLQVQMFERAIKGLETSSAHWFILPEHIEINSAQYSLSVVELKYCKIEDKK